VSDLVVFVLFVPSWLTAFVFDLRGLRSLRASWRP